MNRGEALKLLENGDKSEVRDAINELAQFEDAEVIKAIIKAVDKFKLKSITEMAKETLMSFKKLDRDVINESLALFNCEEPKVRAMAIEVIASFWNDSVDYLDVLIKNSDYNMRKYGVDVLALVPTRKSLEDLALLINDKNPNVKYSAIEALAYFEAYRDRVLEIVETEFEKVNIEDMYGVVSIIEAIIKGAYKSEELLKIAKDKLLESRNSFIKHYLYKLILTLGDATIIDEARENAKLANLIDDWAREEKFYTGKGD